MDFGFLKKFIKQANTGGLKTKDYPGELLDLKMRVSFGEGTLAKIPWVALRKSKVDGGYNPVYLFYKNEGVLILSYGISEKKKPRQSWDENIHETKTKISDYIDNPWRYGNSYIHKHYQPKIEGEEVCFYRDNKKLSDKDLSDELIEIVDYFKNCLELEPEENISSSIAWFVGSQIDNKDCTEKFIKEGYWEHGFDDKYLDEVKSMKEGDLIAIKATYTRKNGLPFETFSNTTSVMAIKANGIIKENPGDGKKVYVNWNKVEPIREWYFYTYRPTVWKVIPGEWMNDALIDFTFNNEEQDINKFINDPFWKDRYTSDEIESYKIENIIQDGAFLDLDKLSLIMRRLKEKKNLILQGPPGTGKTWLAKRLGMALIEEDIKDKQISTVQFHPNLSYEDFVRGWRPGSDEKLSLQEGVFMEMVNRALENPDEKYVLVIEEINRGNPAQIFGELLTLIESSKRNSREAIKLCYPNSEGLNIPVYVPSNLYIIGTMNVADRSLALVDMAFRRRFAFINLEPNLNQTWKDFVVSKLDMDTSIANYIQSEIGNLNNQISSDSRLGKDFQIGHSFFTPNESLKNKDSKKWFVEMVESEIAPLLQEYWFDSLEEADKAVENLLKNL